MPRLCKKLREGRDKLEEDNRRKGLKYESGMMGPHAKDKEVIKEDGEIVNNKQQVMVQCLHCKSNTRQCKTSKLCAMNPNNLALVDVQNSITNFGKKVRFLLGSRRFKYEGLSKNPS